MMGVIIAVVAVFVIHIEMNAVVTIKPATKKENEPNLTKLTDKETFYKNISSNLQKGIRIKKNIKYFNKNSFLYMKTFYECGKFHVNGITLLRLFYCDLENVAMIGISKTS